jgi:hypothetical protein
MDSPKVLGETEVDGKIIVKWIWIVSEPVVSNDALKTKFLNTFVTLAIMSYFVANLGTEAGKEQKRRNSLCNMLYIPHILFLNFTARWQGRKRRQDGCVVKKKDYRRHRRQLVSSLREQIFFFIFQKTLATKEGIYVNYNKLVSPVHFFLTFCCVIYWLIHCWVCQHAVWSSVQGFMHRRDARSIT